MPRVTIKKKEYKVSDFSKWLVGKMYERDLSQTDLANLIGFTQQAFSYRLKKGLFNYSEMLVLLEKLEATDFEILNLMKLKENTLIGKKL